jgi:hypothetical protein
MIQVHPLSVKDMVPSGILPLEIPTEKKYNVFSAFG